MLAVFGVLRFDQGCHRGLRESDAANRGRNPANMSTLPFTFSTRFKRTISALGLNLGMLLLVLVFAFRSKLVMLHRRGEELVMGGMTIPLSEEGIQMGFWTLVTVALALMLFASIGLLKWETEENEDGE